MLEIPTPSEQATKLPTYAFPGGRWTTRMEGDKPKALGTGGGYIYARERKTGYLTKAPCEPSERAKRAEHVVYMDEYGEHEDGIVQRLGIDALHHPWDMLLRFGGAKEFPLEQIKEHMWQWNPPVIDGEVVNFPQLEGLTFDAIHCPFCSRQMPSDQGKHNHITVMHADRVAADDLASGVTKGMTAALKQASGTGHEESTNVSIPAVFYCEKEGCNRFFDSKQGRDLHATKPHEQVMAT